MRVGLFELYAHNTFFSSLFHNTISGKGRKLTLHKWLHIGIHNLNYKNFNETIRTLIYGRLERVNIWKRGSQAKIVGTIVTIGGAMIMTFIRGPMLNLPWTKPNHPSSSSSSSSSINHHNQIKGSLMITIGCICQSAFIILQVNKQKFHFCLLKIIRN